MLLYMCHWDDHRIITIQHECPWMREKGRWWGRVMKHHQAGEEMSFCNEKQKGPKWTKRLPEVKSQTPTREGEEREGGREMQKAGSHHAVP